MMELRAKSPRDDFEYGRHNPRPQGGPKPKPRQRSADSSSPFTWPRNETEFRQALQSFADERYVGMLDPRTHVELSSTLTISQPNHDGSPWGFNGNYAKVDWVGPVGEDMIVYRGIKGVANRNLVIEKINLYGNGYSGHPAGDCLKLYAPEGDPGSIYKFTLRDIYAAYGTRGLVLEGAVFEGMGENVHSENHAGDGIALAHTYTPGEHQGIVSNIMLVHPNSSRNLGAGIRSVCSVNMIMGSFINNALGGVVAPDGLRFAAACNGENTGESLFVVPYVGWGSLLIGNQGSTNGELAAAKWENGQWVTVGKPMLYLLDNQNGDVPQEHNSIAAYGNATSPPVALIKPTSRTAAGD